MIIRGEQELTTHISRDTLNTAGGRHSRDKKMCLVGCRRLFRVDCKCSQTTASTHGCAGQCLECPLTTGSSALVVLIRKLTRHAIVRVGSFLCHIWTV